MTRSGLALLARRTAVAAVPIALSIAVACAALPARAHGTNPARRSVAVQAEHDAAVLLVTWTVPSGDAGLAYTGLAAWGRHGEAARRALTTELAAKAIGPLEIRLDGIAVHPKDVKVKLAEDPPGSGRLAAAVLLTVPIDGGTHRLECSIRAAPEITLITGIDRSRGRASIATPGITPLLSGEAFVVTWRGSGAGALSEPPRKRGG